MKLAVGIIVLTLLSIEAQCQVFSFWASPSIPEQLNTITSNNEIDSIYVYFTGGHREYDRIENKLIEIFTIDRIQREVKQVNMDYNSYSGYWTLYKFNENWRVIELRKYKEDTVIYSKQRFAYNDSGEALEEKWFST